MESPTALTLRSQAVTPIMVRPSDIVSSSGQLQVLPQGMPISLSAWPIDASLQTVCLPTIRYVPTTQANHSGTLVAMVQGMPRTAGDMGFRLDLTVFSNSLLSGSVVLALALLLPCPKDGTTDTWDYQQYNGTLTINAFPNSSAPAKVITVPLAAATPLRNANTPATIVCVDGSTLPRSCASRDRTSWSHRT